VDVQFSPEGEYVNYTTVHQHEFQPTQSAPLETDVTLFNMPYMTAVAVAGNETQLLRIAAREGRFGGARHDIRSHAKILYA